MKNLINISFLTFIFSALIAACTGQGKLGNASQQQLSTDDSVIVTDSEIVSGRVIEDTVIGYWTVKTTKDSNEVVVGRDDWAVRDSSVFLTLSYGNKAIFSGKEIRTKDVVGNEGEYMMQWGDYVFWASDSAIYLSFGCFLPDTDDGWNMLYQILPDGTSNLSVLEYEMGVDGNSYIADFMALYLNERAVGASTADLKLLYEHFCTKELAEELSAATIPIISDDTDFRHADRTLQINNLDDLNGLPLEKYSFEVKFKPNPNDDNVTDILYMEVNGAQTRFQR
ncbi:hypothetical protein [Muribaculum intestinale]|jgi:hypothetical protein|uniref:hypothetical protein n=1 Tax=Muribaculum intestinale TaxID=1796646 RepID=UPI0025B0BC42|nr:hypothetical protein [Muribaculum intestinale]